MQLILLQDVEKLGSEGDLVTVKDGFGRNFLIPRGLAALATPNRVKAHQEEIRQASRKLAKKKEDADRMAKQLAAEDIVIPVKVGEENRIFGTVTAQSIANALSAKGFAVDRRKIEIAEDIRLIGVYAATVDIHPEVTAEIKIRVVSDSAQESETE